MAAVAIGPLSMDSKGGDDAKVLISRLGQYEFGSEEMLILVVDSNHFILSPLPLGL